MKKVTAYVLLSKKTASLFPEESYEGSLEIVVEAEINETSGEVEGWVIDDTEELKAKLMQSKAVVKEIEANLERTAKELLQEFISENREAYYARDYMDYPDDLD